MNIFQSWLCVWVSWKGIVSINELKLDSNISEHSHLFDELDEQLSSKFHSIIVKLQNSDQYSSIHNILKVTKTELNKVKFCEN